MPVVLLVFVGVYLGMIFGRMPGLALDRTGIALLGAIVLIASGRLVPQAAWNAIDVPTMALLFGLMVVTAQFQLGGFYARLTHFMADRPVSPRALLGLLIAIVGGLSAVLTNDIVCLAVAPPLVHCCARKRWDPVPFLLALACASNVGSAATLIGNPQNMLIGQVLNLSFLTFLWQAGVPALLGLLAVWLVIARQYSGRWECDTALPAVVDPAFDRWQTAKGVTIIVGLMAAFLFTTWPRDVVALAGAALVLTSRKTHSARFLQLVDWPLLVLFAGLFIVNHAFAETGLLSSTVTQLQAAGIRPEQPGWLFVVTVLLSNLVSNVPATMLLLPVATHSLAGPILALAGTLAGNLLLVGSIANLIVVDQAARMNVRIGWVQHARVGVPVSAATLAIAAAWLWLVSRI